MCVGVRTDREGDPLMPLSSPANPKNLKYGDWAKTVDLERLDSASPNPCLENTLLRPSSLPSSGQATTSWWTRAQLQAGRPNGNPSNGTSDRTSKSSVSSNNSQISLCNRCRCKSSGNLVPRAMTARRWVTPTGRASGRHGRTAVATRLCCQRPAVPRWSSTLPPTTLTAAAAHRWRMTRGLPGHKQRLVEVLLLLRLQLRPLRHGNKVAVLGRLVGKQAGQLRDKPQDILQDRPPATLQGRQMDRLVRAMDKVQLEAMKLRKAQLGAMESQKAQLEAMKLQKV